MKNVYNFYQTRSTLFNCPANLYLDLEGDCVIVFNYIATLRNFESGNIGALHDDVHNPMQVVSNANNEKRIRLAIEDNGITGKYSCKKCFLKSY